MREHCGAGQDDRNDRDDQRVSFRGQGAGDLPVLGDLRCDLRVRRAAFRHGDERPSLVRALRNLSRCLRPELTLPAAALWHGQPFLTSDTVASQPSRGRRMCRRRYPSCRCLGWISRRCWHSATSSTRAKRYRQTRGSIPTSAQARHRE